MKKLIFTTLLISVSLFASNYERNYANYSVQDKLYIQECGSCHMAFQPEFLPQRSWNKMMATLENHFDVDATFDPKDENLVRSYLLRNASDAKRVYGEIGEFAEAIGRQSTPLAISKTPKFKREHREIPRRLISQKEVKSISNCMACHKDAKEGLYKERNIFIPNFGRWDD